MPPLCTQAIVGGRENQGRMESSTARERLAAHLRSRPPLSESEATARRLRQAVEMADAGLAMMRLNLQRDHPEASADELESLFRDWLFSRPGAEHGDACGRPASERRARL